MDVASLWIVGFAALIAGGIASIAGFGIGSVLTPALSLWLDAKVAVALVSIPHLIGTALRFWLLEGRADRRVLWSFGLASAAGGLAGALIGLVFTSPGLMRVLAVLLLFVAVSEFTGWSGRMVFHGAVAWIAGALSGLLGGLVGNQGGLRAAALLGFQMSRDTFVATVTAIGLFVDAARMPIYFAFHARELMTLVAPIVVATAGVCVGTIAGGRILRRIPERLFRRIVAVLLAMLGIALLIRN
jgi:uncharacterized membrane protein YfcA